MPEYQILPDDRGWPTAHLVLADGSCARDATGQLSDESPVWMDLKVNHVPVATAKLTVRWFAIEGKAELIPLEWEVESDSPAVADTREGDPPVAVEIDGRTAIARWCGVGRLCGRTAFPFTRTEWASLRAKAS